MIFRERTNRRISATVKGKAPRGIPCPASHPRAAAGSGGEQSNPPRRRGLPTANPGRGGRVILGIRVQLQPQWWSGTGWTPQFPQGWLRGAELHLTNPRLTEGWARDVASGQSHCLNTCTGVQATCPGRWQLSKESRDSWTMLARPPSTPPAHRGCPAPKGATSARRQRGYFGCLRMELGLK